MATAHTLGRDPIQTARLLIRPFTDADLDVAWAFNGDATARRYTGGVVTRDQSDAGMRAHIRAVSRSGLGARAVVERATDTTLGYCGLQPFADTEEIELFYGLVRGAWGRGVASEAGEALVALGFAELAIDRIVAIVHPENVGSVRVLEKLGFGRAGTYLHPRWNVEHWMMHCARASAGRARPE